MITSNKINLQFVIPAFGQSPYIAQCIESLLAQELPCDIFIATSTPSLFLEELATRYDVKLFINQNTGRGIASDWNFVFQICDADLLVIAHQDDLYLPQFSKEALALFSRKPEIGIAFTDCYELLYEKKSAWHKREAVKKIIREIAFFGRESIFGHLSYRMLLSFGCPIPCPAVVFQKSKIGNFHFSGDFQVNLDWDAWHRLSNLGVGFGYIRKRLMIHRIHDGAETQAAIQDDRRSQEDLKMFSRFWPAWVVKPLMALYRLGY